MLGIRLTPPVEAALERHARELGRPKSVVARDWIVERLERESIDTLMRRAAEVVSRPMPGEARPELDGDAWSRALEAEDGGYDWGPEGPPV